MTKEMSTMGITFSKYKGWLKRQGLKDTAKNTDAFIEESVMLHKLRSSMKFPKR